MKNFIVITLVLLAFIACSSAPKATNEVAALAPPPPAEISTALVNLKSLKNKKISGMVHFTQNDNKLKMEAMFQGLKSGPYIMTVSDITDCQYVSVNKNLKEISEVIADRKGSIKSSVNLADLSTQDLTGRTLILQTKQKKGATVVACGLVESK